MSSKSDTHVGYGKPPIGSRFRKGQSGNPKGRAKGSVNLRTLFEKTAFEQVEVSEGGKTKRMSKLEIAIKRLMNEAASGNLPAMRMLLLLAQNFDAAKAGDAADRIDESADRKIVEGIIARISKQPAVES